MNAIQLEFNVTDETESEIKIAIMQKQLDAMHESMGKVRRKLFSQMGELQKLYLELKTDNEILREVLRELKNEKTEWIYTQGGNLFDVREA